MRAREDELDRLVERDQPAATSDELEEIRDLVRDAQRCEDRVEELKMSLDAVQRERDDLVRHRIPEKMDRLGLRSLSVAPSGNLPGLSVKVKTFCSANIAANWSPERRREAFDWLEANGHGGLIKTTVQVDFPREERDEARRVAKFLELEGQAVTVRESVHPQTLTSWFKEVVRGGEELPPLDVVGGFVERRAEVEVAELEPGPEK